MLYILIENVHETLPSVNEKYLYQLFFNCSINEKNKKQNKNKKIHGNFVF